FDDFQGDLAGVGQTVNGGDGDVGRLVFPEQESLVVTGHPRSTGNHDPVFGTVVMLLQRQAGARLDHDAFDLKAIAAVDGVVAAPGAIDRRVVLRFGAPVAGEGVDQMLDVLHPILVGDHHRILGFHHDHVLETDQGHQLVLAVGQAVLTVVDHHVAGAAVAVVVLLLNVPQRGPGADVVPAGFEWHHTGAVGLFHHGVVDGIVRAALEGAGVD